MRRPPRAHLHAFCLQASEKCLNQKPRRQNPQGARRSAERGLTPESHLGEKGGSSETIERGKREQLATFESMLRKTKVNLRDAMMRRSKKFYSMSHLEALK